MLTSLTAPLLTLLDLAAESCGPLSWTLTHYACAKRLTSLSARLLTLEDLAAGSCGPFLWTRPEKHVLIADATDRPAADVA